MEKSMFLIVLLTIPRASFPALNQNPNKIFNVNLESGEGNPLILTKYLENGEFARARKLSKVIEKPFSIVESYSGYFTTDPRANSNIFFWFFPSQHGDRSERPLLLWLNGGPGSSSLFGLFVENGPFVVNQTDFISLRNTSWTQTNNVLFVDSPVGTGFSFTDTENGYAQTMSEVIGGLYSTLRQFFILFPEFTKSKFYLTGESFAGKYIPYLAQRILEENARSPNFVIPLVGLSIGNGFIDPENSMNYSEFLYDMGLIDQNTKIVAEFLQHRIIYLIKRRKWHQAFQEYDKYIGYSGRPSFIAEHTGSDFYYNILIPRRPLAYDSYTQYVNQAWARRALHTGNRHFQNGSKVMRLLEGEIMRSARPVVESLLNHGGLRILLYNGQLDLIVANRLTDSFISSMEGWSGRYKFLQSPRKIWRPSASASGSNGHSEIGGYYKTLGNFTRLTIRNCGHMVPYDQPKLGYLFIVDFLNGKFNK